MGKGARKSRVSKSSTSNLRRKKKLRKTRKVISIIVDGKTEKKYFSSMKADLVSRKDSLKISFDDCHGKTKDMIQLIKKKRKVSDEVYCLVDVDRRDRQELEKLVKYNNHKIKIIVSDPCFELWFLLHFQAVTASFENCGKVKQRLKTHLPKYNKTDGKNYAKTKKHIKKALHNAEKLGSSNPSTDVHILVKRFLVKFN